MRLDATAACWRPCRCLRLSSAGPSTAPPTGLTGGLASRVLFHFSLHHSYRNCAARSFGYSAYDSVRRSAKRRNTRAGDNTGGGTPRRGGDSIRPTQSPSERLRESRHIFPETLKSGRYKQQGTRAQRLYGGGGAPGERAPDRRFYRRVEDYREVQDDDPYAGVFAERASVKKRRVEEWQRQFEEENAHVELPYERTNVIARLAPNWFVRYFLNMRDKGGVDHLGLLWLCVIISLGLLWAVGYMFYTPPQQARSIAEVR